MPPRVKFRTTVQSRPSLCSQTRVTTLNISEIVKRGIASFTPNTHTNTGTMIIPPPEPAAPAIVNPTVETITTAPILISSSKTS